MTDPTDTPIGDQVQAEHVDDQPDTAQPDITTHDSEVDADNPITEGTFNAVDGSERPKYGFHDGRFYVTFTVAGGNPLDEQQLADCAGNVRLHAVNSGYIATDNSHDVVTQTSEDGKVAQVIVSVPVRENRAAGAEVPEQDNTGSEG
jgi:hypothetical protein